MNGGDGVLAVTGAALLLAALLLRVRGSPIFRGTFRQPRTDTSLGKAHEGVHRLRFADVAAFDLIGSVAAAMVLAAVSNGSTTAWLIVVLLVGEVQHAWYGIPTATQRWLFGYE